MLRSFVLLILVLGLALLILFHSVLGAAERFKAKVNCRLKVAAYMHGGSGAEFSKCRGE